MAAHGTGISGGDRIYIEFAKRWSKKHPTEVFFWEEGYQMAKRQHLDEIPVVFHVSKMYPWRNFGFFINYLARIFEGIRIALFVKIDNSPSTLLYSSSEFWMDTIPSYIFKLRFPKITWVATWYQTAPNPFVGFAEGKREKKYRLTAFLYWFSQLPIKPILKKYADFVLVNNEDERKQFPLLDKKGRVAVVIGAVNVLQIKAWMEKHKNIKKVYDAAFQGRFHAQKGVVEMIDIWGKVVKQFPKAILTMIGDGPLKNDVVQEIEKLGLKKNIILWGYVFDGDKKYTIFSQSRIVVHPAFFDSGGMASAEAMAFGLPCVGFDLPSYKSYYPRGMVKVPIGDVDAFADKIIELLKNKALQEKVGSDAVAMIRSEWSWEKRAGDILKIVETN